MKILLAIDGPKSSALAVEATSVHPWPTGTIVRVLSVVDQALTTAPEIAALSAETIQTEYQQRTQVADQQTTRFADWLASNGLATEKKVREGNPKSVIVHEAEEWGADLIVVGSHGHTGLKGWLLGSVAQSVVSHAPCSVYIVRERTENQG